MKEIIRPNKLKIFDDIYTIEYVDEIRENGRYDNKSDINHTERTIYIRNDRPLKRLISDIVFYMMNIIFNMRVFDHPEASFFNVFYVGFTSFLLQNDIETLKVFDVVNLFGWKFNIEFVDKINHLDESAIGQLNVENFKIKLEKNMHPDETFHVFIHECVHAIDFCCHNFYMELSENETERLTLAFKSFIIQNGDLIKQLRQFNRS